MAGNTENVIDYLPSLQRLADGGPHRIASKTSHFADCVDLQIMRLQDQWSRNT
jgi:hypothetical protein